MSTVTNPKPILGGITPVQSSDPNRNLVVRFSPQVTQSNGEQIEHTTIRAGSNNRDSINKYARSGVPVVKLFQQRDNSTTSKHAYQIVYCIKNVSIWAKFIQLLVGNMLICLLPQVDAFKQTVNESMVWRAYLAIVAQLVFWLIEQNTIHTLPDEQQKNCCTCLINVIYTICLSYIGAFLYIYTSSALVPGIAAIISFLYFVFYANSKLSNMKWTRLGKSCHATDYDIFRPGTKETRLEMGPHLVSKSPEVTPESFKIIK